MLGKINLTRVNNLMKTKEYQKLSYGHLVFLFAIVGFCSFLVIPTLNRQRDEDKIVNAKRQAEILGYQVFEIYHEAARNQVPQDVNSSRGVASVKSLDEAGSGLLEGGSIGNDPWGQPYRYKILNADQSQLKVQIWSAGPNRVFETKDQPGVAADSYAGDDVGVVLSMNQKPQQ